jgi:hypothetical protein
MDLSTLANGLVEGMRLLDCGTFLRLEFDHPLAWGYIDIPLPRWVVRTLYRIKRLKLEMDRSRSD